MARHDLRSEYRVALAIGLLASLGIHVLLLRFGPALGSTGSVTRAGALRVVDIPPAPAPAPPATTLPADPPPIPAPSLPIASTIGSPPPTPEFIPYEIGPKLENSEEVQRFLQELYPADYRSQRIGGLVVLWLYIDTEGNVARVQIRIPSGHDLFDTAAREVAHRMAFRPAYIHGHPVGVWVSQGIRFQVQTAAADTEARRAGAKDSLLATGRQGHRGR